MDEKYLEQAEEFAARLIESGINLARKAGTISVPVDGCCACGEEIPPTRLSYGYYNCVECQTAIERKGKFMGT